MLCLDLEHATPLKARDVLSAHIIDNSTQRSTRGQGLVQVRHLVVKMRTIEPVAEQIRAAGFELTSIDCWNADGTAPLPVNFLATGIAAPISPPLRFARGTAAIAGLLGLSALVIFWGKQEIALARLTAETLRLQESSRETHRSTENARAAAAGIDLVRRLKAGRVPATLILEEATRLLPDTAWLQEFRLDNDAIEIGGLAASASSLLPAFERSALFHEARFTEALRLETSEDRERFRLRARLRPALSDVGPKQIEGER